ncbi:ABC transporter permease [Paenibacillus thermotolerans]|uniref:ABC transporter permease n=1 Tax=Paenibacillus thermotolerans TaxID=3027807 RepID=UPI0023675B4A|nr:MULTISPECIES: ABC transporter permease [unclassified Paenibacillus]
MVLHKMINNKWLQLSLLAGLVVTVALVSSIPVYIDAVLQRMLMKDMERLQQQDNVYPGALWTKVYSSAWSENDKVSNAFKRIDTYMDNVESRMPVPVIHYVEERETIMVGFDPLHPDKVDPTKQRAGKIAALKGVEDNAVLVDGRWAKPGLQDGAYEAVVFNSALTELHMVLGNEFVVAPKYTDEKIVIRPVGVINRKDERDLFFYGGSISKYKNYFLIPFETFETVFESKEPPVKLTAASWYYAVDYTKITLDNVKTYLGITYQIERYVSRYFDTNGVHNTAGATLQKYFEREKRLRTLLWSLNVPVLIMLSWYLFMVSNLIISRQKTEIAVLRSRGASRIQILISYALEGIILGGIAFLIGPIIALGLTKWLGASNGFLEFVQRASLQVKLDREAYEYALYAVIASFVMTMIPAALATRATIVDRKREQSRSGARPLWQVMFLDVILLGVSYYMLTNFHKQMDQFTQLGLKADQFAPDPMLFFIPALFMLGFGLLLLRVYPWLIKLVYWIGRRWWPPALYTILLDIGRGGARYHYLMIFLVLTVGTGMYSASAARTINQNMEDAIRYKNGADMVLTTLWQNDAPPAIMGAPGGPPPAESAPPKKISYIEPPFEPFTKLPGVEHAAQVFIQDDAFMRAGEASGDLTLVGINTQDFGQTTWFRNDLLQHHLNEYLNLIAEDPSAVLISRSMADQKGVKVGDTMEINWKNHEPALFTVYGVIDYFPGFSPLPEAPTSDGEKPPAPMLAVGHLSYIQNRIAIEPYSIWLKLTPDASRQELFDTIVEKRLMVTNLQDTREQLIQMKNDPFHLSVNGVMTLGFLISVAISFIGFLLYWILSLQARALQFGLFRALGMPLRSLLTLLGVEQVLTTAAALAFGLGTGIFASRLFVPLFKMSFNQQVQVPPFRVIIDARDTFGLNAIVFVMIVIGFIALGSMVSRIKIHQALKLGED